MGSINICITVDWEGESLDNINDLIKIRKKIGAHIPFTHFICPNYFTSRNKEQQVSKRIGNAIEYCDEIGLHVHCYKDLISSIPELSFKTDFNYHNTPSWFETHVVEKLFPVYSRKVTGRGVPLSVYTKDEIEKIISKSRELLCQNLNLESVTGFRAGGWIANDTVLEVVEELGFVYDSSAVAPSILSKGFNKQNKGNLRDDFGDYNGIFTDYLIKLWGYQEQVDGFLKNKSILRAHQDKAIHTASQPYQLNNLIEIPNNCGLSEYCSVEKTVLPLIKCYLDDLKRNPEASYLIVYGCHQESEYQYKLNLLRLFSKLSKMDNSLIKFSRMCDVPLFNRKKELVFEG